MTTAERIFELPLHGVDIPMPSTIDVPEFQLTAELQAGAPLRLKVRVTDVSEQEADTRANRVAQTLYRRFLLQFGRHIERSEPLRSIAHLSSFPGTASMSGKTTGKALVGASPTVILPLDEVDDLVKDVALRVITPEVPTSAQLYTAIDMYAAGLESQNKVVRFLVFYSALALAALFKWHDGRQQNVDRLIQDSNPSVSVSASPKFQNVNETLYTKLRNELIHAEERGCDPAGAIAAIENHLPQFQRDVSLVFSRL
jgi:hypothetical protein